MMFTKRKPIGIILGLLLLASVVASSSRLSTIQAQANGPSTPPPIDHAALDAYWAMRHGPITAADYQQALQQARRLPQAAQLPPVTRSNGQQLGATPLSGNWTSIGPAPISSGFGGGNSSGRISALAIDPTTSGTATTIYIGAADGGVWKSTNNGVSWVPLTDTQTTLASGAIAIDPNNHNIVYVGTGEPNQSLDSYKGAGVLKSIDAGMTWILLGNSVFRGVDISRIAIDPKNSNVF